MDPITISSIFAIGGKLIDKLFPDPEQRAKAQLELLKMQQDGELEGVKVQLSAIIAEAQSPDPWTSRARPSFLYVVYILLLMSIPMGILTIFNPEAAANLTTGFKAWLAAIPDAILTLFGTVMTGYVIGRSWEKTKGIK
jgi:hypothetical protein